MYIGYIFLVMGVLARMFIPYLVKLYKNSRAEKNGNTPAKLNWEWKYLRGQAIAALIIFIAFPLLVSDLASVGGWDQQAAFLAGYGVAEIGRFVDATITE